MLRELNELEYLCYAVGQPFNIACMLRIKGSISTTLIKSTLKKLQKKNPLLNVRIDFNEKKHPYFTSENVREIPVTIIKRKNDFQAFKEFNKQLVTAFDLTNIELPLFRVVLFSSLEKSDLIFCSMHIISDGLSMTFFVEEFIKYIINPDEPVVRLNFPEQNLDIFKPKIRKMIPKTQIFSYMIYFLLYFYNLLRYAFLGKAKNPKINVKENEIEIYSCVLTAEQTNQLFKRCRKEGVTVHSSLCTAFLQDFQTIATAISLREKLMYSISKSFGFYSSTIILNKRYKKSLSFWENARRFQKILSKNLRDRIAFLPIKIISKKASFNLLRKIGALYVGIVTKKHAFSINNLGALDKYFEEIDLKKFPEIDAIYGGITSFMDLLIVLVYTFHKKLHFHYHFPIHKYNSNQIKALSENAINRLLNAIELV